MGDARKGDGAAWMSVPAFGDWDMKHGVPDYSMDFSKIREMRKQNKNDFTRVSVGNEDELKANKNHNQHAVAAAPAPASLPGSGGGSDADAHRASLILPCEDDHFQHQDSPTGRKKVWRYLLPCLKA